MPSARRNTRCVSSSSELRRRHRSLAIVAQLDLASYRIFRAAGISAISLWFHCSSRPAVGWRASETDMLSTQASTRAVETALDNPEISYQEEEFQCDQLHRLRKLLATREELLREILKQVPVVAQPPPPLEATGLPGQYSSRCQMNQYYARFRHLVFGFQAQRSCPKVKLKGHAKRSCPKVKLTGHSERSCSETRAYRHTVEPW